jgi:hypothetical protein
VTIGTCFDAELKSSVVTWDPFHKLKANGRLRSFERALPLAVHRFRRVTDSPGRVEADLVIESGATQPQRRVLAVRHVAAFADPSPFGLGSVAFGQAREQAWHG